MRLYIHIPDSRILCMFWEKNVYNERKNEMSDLKRIRKVSLAPGSMLSNSHCQLCLVCCLRYLYSSPCLPHISRVFCCTTTGTEPLPCQRWEKCQESAPHRDNPPKCLRLERQEKQTEMAAGGSSGRREAPDGGTGGFGWDYILGPNTQNAK